MQILLDDTASGYVQDAPPVSEKHYRARFYLDMSSMAMSAADGFDLFTGYYDADSNGSDDDDEIEFNLRTPG